MKITRRNAVLFLLWVVFVISLPIYVFWTVFNYENLRSWTEKKFCGFLDKQIIQKQFIQRKMNNYCKKCRLRDGCLQKCKYAEVYEQGHNDAVKEFKNAKKTVKVYEA